MSLLQGPKDYLDLGNHNVICDVCGFKFKGNELRRRWDGFMVCPADFEHRHPQDTIKIPREKPLPSYVRPVPPDQFVTVAPVDGSTL